MKAFTVSKVVTVLLLTGLVLLPLYSQASGNIFILTLLTRIVADLSGGGGKNTIAEWQQRFGIPLTAPLKKKMKRAHIALMNDEARQGRLLVNTRLSELIREYQTVCWDAQRKGPDPRYANDCLDAVEYAWTAALHYAGKPPDAVKALTQEERYAIEEQALEARELRRHRATARRRVLGH